jgi:anti-sigma factor RsiW
MRCPLGAREDAELLVAYTSRKLDAAKTAFVEAHLENCGECQEFVRQQQAVWEALDLWEAEPVSTDFNRRLYQRIEAQVSWWERVLRPLRPLVAHKGVPLAAAASLVLVAAAVLDHSAAPPPKPAPNPAQVATVESLQPEQVVNALDQMEELNKFNRRMRSDTPDAKM